MPMTLAERYAAAIAYERTCQRMSTSRFAALSGTSPGAWYKIATGRQTLTVDHIESAANALDLEPAELLQLALIVHELPAPRALNTFQQPQRRPIRPQAPTPAPAP